MQRWPGVGLSGLRRDELLRERVTALKRLLTRENVLAVMVFLLLLALIIFLHGATPTFIYQGF